MSISGWQHAKVKSMKTRQRILGSDSMTKTSGRLQDDSEPSESNKQALREHSEPSESTQRARAQSDFIILSEPKILGLSCLFIYLLCRYETNPFL